MWNSHLGLLSHRCGRRRDWNSGLCAYKEEEKMSASSPIVIITLNASQTLFIIGENTPATVLFSGQATISPPTPMPPNTLVYFWTRPTIGGQWLLVTNLTALTGANGNFSVQSTGIANQKDLPNIFLTSVEILAAIYDPGYVAFVGGPANLPQPRGTSPGWFSNSVWFTEIGTTGLAIEIGAGITAAGALAYYLHRRHKRRKN
jgi:hypothetical protein